MAPKKVPNQEYWQQQQGMKERKNPVHMATGQNKGGEKGRSSLVHIIKADLLGQFGNKRGGERKGNKIVCLPMHPRHNIARDEKLFRLKRNRNTGYKS